MMNFPYSYKTQYSMKSRLELAQKGSDYRRIIIDYGCRHEPLKTVTNRINIWMARVFEITIKILIVLIC